MFEDTRDSQSSEGDTTTTNTQTFDTQETYSLSSDYTGSFVNQDEFTDINEDEDEADDYTYDEMRDESEETATYTEENTTCASSYCSSVESSLPPPPRVAPVKPVLEIQHEQQSLLETEPLFSIKEYRRQKRRNNGRRSSVMPRPSLSTNVNKDLPSSKVPVNKAKAALNVAVSSQCHADDQAKKSKYLERIKVIVFRENKSDFFLSIQLISFIFDELKGA